MAVSPAYTFDYEVRLRARDDRGLEGSAESLQQRAGTLPGLAGRAPLVFVSGDEVRLEPRTPPSRVSALVETFAALIPPLHDWLVDRRLEGASVRGIELFVPGLGASLQPGHVLRVTLVTEAQIPVHPPAVDVFLGSDGVAVKTWKSVSVNLIR